MGMLTRRCCLRGSVASTQGPSYVLPSRSRMGDDTPGHKADPAKRGGLGRSKPDGLMYLALQTAQEEERHMSAAAGSQGASEGLVGVGGRMASMASMGGGGNSLGVVHGEGAMQDAEMLGSGGGKLQLVRRRAHKISNRLTDRKSILSMRLKEHWKRKDEAKRSSKSRGAGGLGNAEGRSSPTPGGDDSRGLTASGFQMTQRRAQGGGGDVQMVGSPVGMQQARTVGSSLQPPPPPAYPSPGPRTELQSPGPAPRTDQHGSMRALQLAALHHPPAPQTLHGDPWNL